MMQTAWESAALSDFFLLLIYSKINLGASLVAQLVKNLPAVQEMWVQSLGVEDLLEKEMATQSGNPP